MTTWFGKVIVNVGNALSKIKENYLGFREILGSKERCVDTYVHRDKKTGVETKVKAVSYIAASLADVKKDRNYMVKNLNDSLINMVEGNFVKTDASDLEAISEDYSALFRTYRRTQLKDGGSFLGNKSKKAILTLEALARANADFLKTDNGNLNFKEFLQGVLTDGKIICAKDKNKGSDGGYAIVTQYGTMHSYILDSILNFSNSGRKQMDLIYQAGEENWDKEMEKYSDKKSGKGFKHESGAAVLSFESNRMPVVSK
ncbi:MAG: hypothetical protein Q8L29_02440 [archaeon]|nr:hypothetical protein [archaeon]